MTGRLVDVVLASVASVLLTASHGRADIVYPCTMDEGRAGIEKALATVQRITAPIERVSPSDTAFFETEEAEALSERNEARYSVLVANPLYPAWEVWSETASVVRTLEAAQNATQPWQRIIDLADAQTVFPKFQTAYVAYRDHDARRPSPVVSEPREMLYLDLASVGSALARTIKCTAAGYR